MRILTAAFLLVVVALVVATRLSAQETNKAVDLIAAARKSIGGKRLDELKTLSLEANVQRNLASMQLTSDVEILLELPDKYVRTDVANSPGMIVGGGMNVGFNGDKRLQPVQGSIGPGGAMMIRMGPGGALPADGPKPTPEEQARVEKQVVRGAKHELSRLMLGWFASAHPGVAVDYTFAGEAESPDGKAYVIDAKNADGFSARLFIDQQSNLPLMVTYQAPQRQVMTARPGPRPAGGPPSGDDAQRQTEHRTQAPTLVDYTLFFDDWRTIDGVRFPHKIRRAMGSETTEEWTVNRVKINPSIDPKKFAVKS